MYYSRPWAPPSGAGSEAGTSSWDPEAGLPHQQSSYHQQQNHHQRHTTNKTTSHYQHHRYQHDDDDNDKYQKRRRGSYSSVLLKYAFLLLTLVAGVCLYSMGMRVGGLWPSSSSSSSSPSTPPAAAALTGSNRGAGLVQQGLDAATLAAAASEATAQELPPQEEAEEPEKASSSSREERQASGRELLLKAVDAALQELTIKRGKQPSPPPAAEIDTLSLPDFQEAGSLLEQAAQILSLAYDGSEEIIEREYFMALEMQAVLRLHAKQCGELGTLLDRVQDKLELSGEEKASVALLRGYCEEALGSGDKAIMYFSIARDMDPEHCFETLGDPNYQPVQYQLTNGLPRGEDNPPYWPALVDLIVFRNLYSKRALLSSTPSATATATATATAATATWPGTLWASTAQSEGDEYGSNLGWGLNEDGVAKAATLLQQNEFVILREIISPFEMQVLERHYKEKVEKGVLSFDSNLGRATSYNDRVGQWLNHQYTRLLSTLVGHSVKHAYSFLCHYEKREGVEPPVLIPHTDREDNQYTTSIQIYSNPEEGRGASWPIFVDKEVILPEKSSWRDMPAPGTSVECKMQNGDALVFLGRRHIHYREAMKEDVSLVSSLLLHFVDKSFDFFDYKLTRQAEDPSI